MTKKFIHPMYFVAAGFCMFLFGKLWHRTASADDLFFLITPVAWLIEIATTSTAMYYPGQGYYFHDLQIIINKSCSGFNLFLISFLLLIYKFRNYLNLYNVLIWIAGIITSSLAFVWLLNSLRILSSILILRIDLPLQPSVAHEIIGVITFVPALIIFYNLPNLMASIKNHYEHIY